MKGWFVVNWWDKFNCRWERENLLQFSSAFRIIYLLLPIFISYIVGDLVEVILWEALNWGLTNASEAVLESLAYHNSSIKGIIYGIGAVIYLLVLKKASKNEITYVPQGKNARKLANKEIAIIVTVSLASAIGLNYLFNLTGFVSSSDNYNMIYRSQFGVDFLVGLFLYGCISPLVEEIIYRGLLYNRLKRIFPLYLSMILSALLFGITHGNIVQGVYGFIMGLLIVWFYEHYESFAAPLLVHIVANVSVYILQFTLWK